MCIYIHITYLCLLEKFSIRHSRSVELESSLPLSPSLPPSLSGCTTLSRIVPISFIGCPAGENGRLTGEIFYAFIAIIYTI